MRYLGLMIFFLLSCNMLRMSEWGIATVTPSETVYIAPIGDDSNQATLDFISAVEAQLNPYNVQVELYSSDFGTDRVISLKLDNRFVLVNNSAEHPRSPILYYSANIPYCGDYAGGGVPQHYEITEESYPLLVDFITGLALYLTGLYEESYTLLADTATDLERFHSFNSKDFHEYWNFYQANNLIMMGDFDTAITLLEEFVLDSANPLKVYTVNLAWLYIQTNRTDEAINLLDNHLTPECSNMTLPEDNWGSWRNPIEIHTRRAQLYALAFDYDSAIADMDAAIELAEANDADNEQLAELYTLRGEIIFLIYEWDRVLDNFNTALELDPDYAPAYFQRGVLYYTMTERENALADFQHYLELAPDGQYAQQAQQYIDSIQLELDALGG